MGSRKVNTEGIDEELLIASIGRRRQDGTLYHAQEPPAPAPEEESVPETAILSAVIFNAIIIPILIPLALKGVQYKPIGASALLRRNLLIYGVGGVIAPFVGIKLIDMIVSLFF